MSEWVSEWVREVYKWAEKSEKEREAQQTVCFFLLFNAILNAHLILALCTNIQTAYSFLSFLLFQKKKTSNILLHAVSYKIKCVCFKQSCNKSSNQHTQSQTDRPIILA